MSSGQFTVFFCAFWLAGFFPVDHPLDPSDVKFLSKKGLNIRRSLILAWSLVLVVYPLLFVLDICFNAEAVPATESGRLSPLIPFGIVMVSTFLINTILWLFSIINSGKLMELVGRLRQLSLESEQMQMGAHNNGPKWKSYFAIWLVYAAIFLTATNKLLHDLATAEYNLKSSKLFLLPQSDVLRILLMNFVFTTTAVPPAFVSHLVVTFGTRLIQIHGSICSELREFLARGHTLMVANKIKANESYEFLANKRKFCG